MSREDKKYYKRSGDTIWDKAKTLELIESVHKMPELWNCACPSYLNRGKKRLAIHALAKQFNIEESEISRKWHNLRCQLNTELRKRKRATARGMVHNSKWKFYKSMEFIVGVTEGRNTVSMDPSFKAKKIKKSNSLEEIIFEFDPLQTDNGNESVPENVIEEPIEQPRTKPEVPASPVPKPAPRSYHSIKKPEKNYSDDDALFGEYVASELRQLNNSDRRKRLKCMIQRAIVAIVEEELEGLGP